MTTSGGSERNRSTMKMISQLSGRMARHLSSANAKPAAMPVTTMRRASSIVTTTPDKMSGRYLSMTLPLKNVSVKRSQFDNLSVPLDLADESARALVGRVLEDRGGRALLHDGALVHEEDPVGGVAGKAHLVADHDHGHAALPQRAHDLEHRAHQLRIEGAGRLVEQHDPGLERDRARDGHPLLLAARELARRVAGTIGEADSLQCGSPQLLGARARLARDLAQRERHVAERRHVRIEVEGLEYHADALPGVVDVGPRVEHVDAVHHDAAGGRLLQPVEAAQQGRLARARRPDHEHQLTFGHPEIDALQDVKGAEMLVDAARVDDRVGHSLRS